MNSSLTSSDIPELLCVGFLCYDLYREQKILGGTAAYASLMASQLGKKTAVFTSVADDFQFFDRFAQAGIKVYNQLAAQTTVFENIYHQGQRTQFLHARAPTLTLNHLPPQLRESPIVKFCLIADELDDQLLHAFPNALVAATIQGWLRQWDVNGLIHAKAMDWTKLAHLDMVLMSIDDMKGFEDKIPQIAEWVPIVVITHGAKGATVYEKGKAYTFPAYPTQQIDPTGAGDIFASSFLVHYAQTRDIAQAAAFAHVAASFVIEGVGVQLPLRSSIEQRLIHYHQQFQP